MSTDPAIPYEAATVTDPTQLPYPPTARGIYVVGILMLVTILSFLDRSLPTLLVQPLRAAFQINDTQISLLQGYGFSLVYVFAGLPLGRLVDRANRRNIILCGLLVWSAMTLLSAFAVSYTMLFVCRMGVGLGEACLAPAAYSLIADYFEPRRHGRAIGVYFTSLSLGSGASLFFGGVALKLLPQEGPIAFLGYGSFEPWQMLFLLAGLPGLATAALLLTVREVPRRDTAARLAARSTASVREFAGYLWQSKRTFGPVYGCLALVGLFGTAVQVWAATFYVRHFDMPISQAGMWVGALNAILGTVGPIAGGWLSDSWRVKMRGGRFQALLVPLTIALPATVAWTLIGDRNASLGLLAVLLLTGSMSASIGPGLVQSIVPNHMRGQAVACYLLVAFLVGFSLGPTGVALATDYLFHDDMMLRYSLLVVCVPTLVLCAALCRFGLASYRSTVQSLELG